MNYRFHHQQNTTGTSWKVHSTWSEHNLAHWCTQMRKLLGPVWIKIQADKIIRDRSHPARISHLLPSEKCCKTIKIYRHKNSLCSRPQHFSTKKKKHTRKRFQHLLCNIFHHALNNWLCQVITHIIIFHFHSSPLLCIIVYKILCILCMKCMMNTGCEYTFYNIISYDALYSQNNEASNHSVLRGLFH